MSIRFAKCVKAHAAFGADIEQPMAFAASYMQVYVAAIHLLITCLRRNDASGVGHYMIVLMWECRHATLHHSRFCEPKAHGGQVECSFLKNVYYVRGAS